MWELRSEGSRGPIKGPRCIALLRLLVFDGDGDRRKNSCGHFRARWKHCRIAVARRDRGRPCAGTSGGSNRRAFPAADDSADDGANDRSAADLRSARVCTIVAVAINRFGGDGKASAVRHDQRLKSDAEASALLELSATIDDDNGADGVGAGRDSHMSANANVAHHMRFDAIFNLRPLAAQ